MMEIRNVFHKGRSLADQRYKEKERKCRSWETAEKTTCDEYTLDWSQSKVVLVSFCFVISCKLKCFCDCVYTVVPVTANGLGIAHGFSFTMWKNKCINLKVKMTLYEGIILSTVLYSADVWPLTATLTKRLNAVHYRWQKNRFLEGQSNK